MTDSTYKIKLNHADRRTANARRIEPKQQSPVYATKSSRTYHRHNCPELNTNDLIEFKSPRDADSAGAIPCKHYNQLASVKENILESKSVKPVDVAVNKRHQPNTEKEVSNKNLEEQEEIGKEVKAGIQSFSIKGLTIGMSKKSALQAEKLIPRTDGNLFYSSIHTGRNKKDLREYTVYSIRWHQRFKNYEKADDILMKLQETYGKWSDIYRSKKNYYYVIWGAKFKKNITENTEWILRETVDNNTSYATDCITGKLFLMARIAPYDDGVCDLSLRLHNNKIYTDALKAEIAREKQQKMKQQEDISKLKFR